MSTRQATFKSIRSLLDGDRLAKRLRDGSSFFSLDALVFFFFIRHLFRLSNDLWTKMDKGQVIPVTWHAHGRYSHLRFQNWRWHVTYHPPHLWNPQAWFQGASQKHFWHFFGLRLLIELQIRWQKTSLVPATHNDTYWPGPGCQPAWRHFSVPQRTVQKDYILWLKMEIRGRSWSWLKVTDFWWEYNWNNLCRLNCQAPNYNFFVLHLSLCLASVFCFSLVTTLCCCFG